MKPLLLALAIGASAMAIAYQAEPQGKAEVSANQSLRDFDLRGDARMLFENVTKAYGLESVFDSDYPTGTPIRFLMQQVDFRTVLHGLEEATGSFIVPLSAKRLLVVKDTPAKRNDFEPHIAATVDIPQAVTAQELTELVKAVQQVMNIDKLAIETQVNRVVFRGPASKVVPAQLMFESLIHYNPQVSIEMEVIEIDKSDVLTYGLDLPSSIPIINFRTVAKVGTQLANLGGVGGMAFGIGVASAQLLAQMQDLSGKQLLHLTLRSINHQAATFHAGDRYPMVTSQYVSGQSSSGNGSSGNGSDNNTPATFGNVARPNALAVNDLNGDGVADVAATASGADAVAIILGNSDGSVEDAVTYATGTTPSAIAVADLDDDGTLDIVTANAGSDDVSVLYGNGDGTFQKAITLKVGAKPLGVAVADFNADGNLDIVTANSDSNDISVILGGKERTFEAATTIAAGTAPRAVLATDLNGDNDPDIVVANFKSNNLTVLLGDGEGKFRTPVTYDCGQAPSALVTADLNRDRSTDLIVTNSVDGTVSVLLGQSNGTFGDATDFSAGANPTSIVAGDFNSDGGIDVVVTNPDSGTISLLLGLGEGSFQAPIAFHPGTQPAAVAARDVNRDSLPDLVTANTSSNNFSLLLGTFSGSFVDPNGGDIPSTGGQTYAPIPSFTFEDLGLLVKVTPHVHGTEEVTLDLDAEFKLLTGKTVSGLPVLSNRKLTTQVRIPNGQWVIVSGLLTSSEARALSGVPLGPFIGKRTRDRDRSEVLILLKTNLLNLPPSEFGIPAMPVGSETRPRLPW